MVLIASLIALQSCRPARQKALLRPFGSWRRTSFCVALEFVPYPSFPFPFQQLWDSTIKPADRNRYGWAANPWVWVIEFEQREKPEEDNERG